MQIQRVRQHALYVQSTRPQCLPQLPVHVTPGQQGPMGGRAQAVALENTVELELAAFNTDLSSRDFELLQTPVVYR